MNFRLQSLMPARGGPKHLAEDVRSQLSPPDCDEGPRKLVLAVTPATHMREMLGSNISPQTDYPD
jgi:hypothetical protein